MAYAVTTTLEEALAYCANNPDKDLKVVKRDESTYTVLGAHERVPDAWTIPVVNEPTHGKHTRGYLEDQTQLRTQATREPHKGPEGIRAIVKTITEMQEREAAA